MDIVGAQEIAARLGVVRGTVDQWRQRGIFPDPDFTLSGRPGWNWTTIETWARETGRLNANHSEFYVRNEVEILEERNIPESALERELRISREQDR